MLLIDQVNILRQHGYQWRSEGLSNQEPRSTFVTMPYDITRFFNKDDFAILDELQAQENYQGIYQFYLDKIEEKNIPLLGTTLDGVYTRNIVDQPNAKPSTCKAMLFTQNGRVKPLPTAEQLQSLAKQAYNSHICPLPSDHLPLKTTIRF